MGSSERTAGMRVIALESMPRTLRDWPSTSPQMTEFQLRLWTSCIHSMYNWVRVEPPH